MGFAPWKLGFCVFLALGASAGWGQQHSPAARSTYTSPVAGLAPSARPRGVPAMGDVARDAEWRAKALRGISEPVPASLEFLQDQGRWYSPFLRPGMTGRYDIRGLHARRSH
jgi:hypothetical protein